MATISGTAWQVTNVTFEVQASTAFSEYAYKRLNLQVATVPEPSSWRLLCAVLLTIPLLAKRRRQ